MATIADVAKRAGVSAATVSRALNKTGSVAESTRARVEAVAAELGYAPSRAAQHLATGRTRTVAVVAPMAASPSVAERLQGLASRLSTTAHDLTLFDISTPPEREKLMSDLANPGRVGAVIVISLAPTPEELRGFQRAGIPLAAIDVRLADTDCVFIDNAEGGRIAAQELLSTGHRRIAFVGDTEDNPLGFTSSCERRKAFDEVLATARVTIPLDYLKLGPHTAEFARQSGRELMSLPTPPTAIFAASDVQAMAVMEAAADLDVDVPGQLSVIGFDDIALARTMGLTTIRQPLEESGAYGAKLILEAIEHEPMGMAVELPLSLVSRRSTGPPPSSS